MKYRSTRLSVHGLTFEEVLFNGYLSDGGMAIPEVIPLVSVATLKSWAGLTYRDIVLKIIPIYVGEDELPLVELQRLVDKALSTFDVPEIAPIKNLNQGLRVMELFHGRTWAFKDLALSIVGQLFDHFLNKKQKHLTIVVGTSGDTGSSAIEAVRGQKWIDIVVILPRGRCTQIQERQMTTVKEDNVFVFRADGTSDDLDQPIKKIFSDAEFVKKYNLCSVNSLNWARIMVQIAHYYYAYLKICPTCDQELEVVVPTGGGGNITAGLMARMMGLPVRFVCAVTSNDIVARMVKSGQCELLDVKPSLAPSIDMQFAYNFERVWYLCSDGNALLVQQMMNELESTGKTKIPDDVLKQMQSAMTAFATDDDGIKQTLKRCWDDNQYLLCPHTAVAIAYYYSHRDLNRPDANSLSVCLATASPLKFPEAITAAGLLPIEIERIREILAAPTYYTDMEKTDDWLSLLRQKIIEMESNFRIRIKDLEIK